MGKKYNKMAKIYIVITKYIFYKNASVTDIAKYKIINIKL